MTCRRASRGFTLVEVMAAVMLLGLFLVVMLGQRDKAIANAGASRNLSIAARLGLQLVHRIECARVPELFDGYEGDFSEDGFPEFRYVVGVGDGSRYASGGTSDAELAWRSDKERKEQEREDKEGDENKPDLTRLFVTVHYPGGPGHEDAEYHLETLAPTWAVDQDFELYQKKWADNLPAEAK